MTTAYFFSKLCFQLVPVVRTQSPSAGPHPAESGPCWLPGARQLPLTYMLSRGICHTITEETRSS